MDELFSAVWSFLGGAGPDIFNTVVALLLGIPFALWTDRRLKARESRATEANNRVRLNRALTVLERALQHNREELLQVVLAIQTQQARIQPALDFSGWDACKNEITPLLHAPDLQRDLAFYFAKVESFLKANQMYLDYFIGVASALHGANASREHLRRYLLETAGMLTAESSALLDEIGKVKEGAGAHET